MANNEGTIEKGISGEYNFSIRAIISEAWDKTHGAKWPFHLAFIYYFLVVLAMLTVLFIASAALSISLSVINLPIPVFTILHISMILVLLPLIMGVAMMGIQRAAGYTIHATSIFGYFSKIFSLFLTLVIMHVMIALGFMLLILPGIYLATAYYMALPLVIEKNMRPWQALETSRKTVTHRWFRMFALLFIMGIIISVSMIPFGIGLIWSLPFFVIAYGIIYRNMFGIEATKL